MKMIKSVIWILLTFLVMNLILPFFLHRHLSTKSLHGPAELSNYIMNLMEIRKANDGVYGTNGHYAWRPGAQVNTGDILPSLSLELSRYYASKFDVEININKDGTNYDLSVFNRSTGHIERRQNALGEALAWDKHNNCNLCNMQIDKRSLAVQWFDAYIMFALNIIPLVGVFATIACIIGILRRGIHNYQYSGKIRPSQFWGFGAILWALSFLCLPQVIVSSVFSMMLYREERKMESSATNIRQNNSLLFNVFAITALTLSFLMVIVGIIALRNGTIRFRL